MTRVEATLTLKTGDSIESLPATLISRSEEIRCLETENGDRSPDALDMGARVRSSRREGESGELVIEGEVMAFDRGRMGRAVEAVMRWMSEEAAILDAVLEMRALRVAEPKSADEEAVSKLRRELSGAGFPVCTDLLWQPSPGGDVWLGADGKHADALRDFIEAHSEWESF